jgi:deazaflavin-dependent oxidoreductase (nitroreductase family)
MPGPRWLARFNRRVTNRVGRPVAEVLPFFGIVIHTGRKSGRTYRTPINVFRRDGKFIFALTYGPRSEWVLNVLAAGGCLFESRGGTVRLTQPRLFVDEQRGRVPPVVRPILRLARVRDFIEMVPA